jgi:hypothetical protein
MKKFKGENIIDSRDIIARMGEVVEELEVATYSDLPDDLHTLYEGLGADSDDADLVDELIALKELESEADNSPDWLYGEALINEFYFTDYIEELIKDCYSMPKEMEEGGWPWDYIEINYDRAAEAARVDYFEVTLYGYTYLIRA